MKWCVCIKEVPDVSVAMQVRDGALAFANPRRGLNAYDASALEAALELTARYGGEVEVVLAGPATARETVRRALAMGAARATHLVWPDDTAPPDAGAVARILARHLSAAAPDVIACGRQSQDTDAGLTGALVAELLGLPLATDAVDLDVDTGGGLLLVTRQSGEGREHVALPLPCLVTCSNDLRDPRIPTLKGIMQAARLPVAEVAVEPAALDGAVRHLRFEPVPERAAGEVVTAPPDAAAQRFLEFLLAHDARP